MYIYAVMNNIEILKQLALDQMSAKHPNVKRSYLVIPKYSDRTANGLTRCIIDFIRLDGYQAERINTMGRTIDNRKRVTDVLGRTKLIGSTTYIPTTGTKGSADISATIRGRSVKVEVKVGKDRQSPEQKAYELSIVSSGGIYWIVRSFDEFYNKYLTLFP
jgi:hypothetical protein